MTESEAISAEGRLEMGRQLSKPAVVVVETAVVGRAVLQGVRCGPQNLLMLLQALESRGEPCFLRRGINSFLATNTATLMTGDMGRLMLVRNSSNMVVLVATGGLDILKRIDRVIQMGWFLLHTLRHLTTE